MNYEVDLNKLEELFFKHLNNPRTLSENLAELVRVGKPLSTKHIIEERVEICFNHLAVMFLVGLSFYSKFPSKTIEDVFLSLRTQSEKKNIQPTLERLISFFSQGIGDSISDFIPMEMKDPMIAMIAMLGDDLDD